MATRLFGISRGENEFQITEGVGSATASDNIELTVDLAVNLKKEDVVLALEKLMNHILTKSQYPAS